MTYVETDRNPPRILGYDVMTTCASDPSIDAQPSPARPLATKLLIVTAGAVAVLRLLMCGMAPGNTTDLVRHLVYGELTCSQGLQSAGQSLQELEIGVARLNEPIPWSEVPYPYPVMALLFFTAVAWVWPSLFIAKLVLTALEAGNALLIGRISGDRWLGLVYWVNPMSIWWVSREGQFETLQSFLVLLSLALLMRSRRLSYTLAAAVLLILAVQVKITAVLLLPLLAWTAWKRFGRRCWWLLPACITGLLPTAAATLSYPAVTNVIEHSTPLHYNPYFWNLLNDQIFSWNPTWLRLTNGLASWVFLAAVLILARRSREPMGYVAPAAFLALIKLHTHVQFWYLTVLPSFLLPINERRVRLLLYATLPLLDVRALLQIVVGPMGYTNGIFFSELSVFEALHLIPL